MSSQVQKLYINFPNAHIEHPPHQALLEIVDTLRFPTFEGGDSRLQGKTIHKIISETCLYISLVIKAH